MSDGDFNVKAGCARMIRHRRKKQLIRMVVDGRMLALSALVCGISATIAPSQARAEGPAIERSARMGVVTGDHHGGSNRVAVRSGNGKFNKDNSSVLSPTINRGVQQVSNTNVSGRTITQVAFCWKKRHFCKISQRLLSGW